MTLLLRPRLRVGEGTMLLSIWFRLLRLGTKGLGFGGFQFVVRTLKALGPGPIFDETHRSTLKQGSRKRLFPKDFHSFSVFHRTSKYRRVVLAVVATVRPLRMRQSRQSARCRRLSLGRGR